MTDLQMPPERKFGWALKPIESAHFAIHERANGQFCVALNHAQFELQGRRGHPGQHADQLARAYTK